jgi:hypothetical protein
MPLIERISIVLYQVRACRAFLLFLTLLLVGSGCATESVQPQAISFDADPAGAVPSGFSTALTGGGGPVSWVVREDAGEKVLVQESADDTSYRFPMCIYDGAVLRDATVEVKFKSVAGKVDQAGGIVLRFSPENYYIARANALEDNIDVFKTVDGHRLKIQEVDAKVAPGVWHTLRFEARGPHLTVIFDGKVAIQAEDSTFTGPGKVGLWTKADSVSEFKDLKIEPAR